MILETNSQGSLYCTFDDKDIGLYFSMSFEEFLKSKGMIKLFSEILIKKSMEKMDYGKIDIRDIDVSIYEIENGKYAINIERKNDIFVIEEDKISDITLTENDLCKLMNYLKQIMKG